MKLTPWFLNFDFGGRARRSHYWANIGAWLTVMVGLLLVVAALKPQGSAAENPAASFITVLMFVALVCSAIDNIAMVYRRAHDTGKSGWIWLLLLIPFVNLLPFYWLMIQDSDQGPNKYGPPVKAFYEPTSA